MTNILQKSSKKLILLLLIVIFIIIICQSKIVMSSTVNSVKLFFYNLFPCMFIFYTIADLMLNYGILSVFNSSLGIFISNIFGITPNSLFIIFFSMLTGFPSGSKYIADFYNKKIISLDEANYLLSFTHFSNPLFVLGTIKIICGFKIAIIVLFSHYLSNIIIALILRPKGKYSNYNHLENNYLDLVTCLNKSFKKTTSIIMIVLCNSIIFTTLGSLICHYIKNHIVSLLIMGFFDITKGISLISNFGFNNLFKGIVISTFLSFGGFSIHMQVKSIIKKEKLSYFYFFHGRLISASITIVLYIILYSLI